jgi:hypothetical protein
MRAYDPHEAPNPEEWLALEEDEQHILVESYHRSAQIELPIALAHAVIHTVVESQLALGISEVQDALNRLMAEGLDRHDALHAIGFVLAGHMHTLVEGPESTVDPNEAYLSELEELTAEKWRRAI